MYGEVKLAMPKNVPEPLGNPVKLTHYVDANLCHDLVSARALTAVLHLINQMLFDWFCKKQATVETATYGSECNDSRSAGDQIIDIRIILRYFGVPILEKSYLFRDNQSVVSNATIQHSQMNKRHHMLAYHIVREAVASNMLSFHFIDGNKARQT